MALFPLVLDGVIVDLKTAVTPMCYPLTWAPDISAATPKPDIGWKAVETNGAWSFTAPDAIAGPTVQQQALAKLAWLDGPGGPAIRCFKAGVPFPADWQAYNTELRPIANVTANPMPKAVPSVPAFAAGT